MEKKNELKEIQEAIKSAGHSWTVKNNFLTDMPEDERKNYLGYVPGPNDPSLEEQEQIASSNYATFLSTDAKSDTFGAPTNVDWRNKNGENYVTAVKNQGGCGSCVAFGSIAAVESKMKIQRGVNTVADLSEAHLFYCIARSQGRTCGGSTGGWWPDKAMDALRDKGVTDETSYPYTAGDQNCSGRAADWESKVVKITGYKKLTSIAAMKEWIATQGPVQACFNVYSDFYDYRSGVYKKVSTKLEGGHCVCIIGYDDTLHCWIAKNSWGTNWGESGFFKIGYGQCGIDSVMYGAEAILETGWMKKKKVQGLFATKEERNAWVFLDGGTGWKKISNNNDNAFLNTVSQLATAKTANSNVDIFLEKDQISSVYVF